MPWARYSALFSSQFHPVQSLLNLLQAIIFATTPPSATSLGSAAAIHVTVAKTLQTLSFQAGLQMLHFH
jgi:hypothetical protein